MKSNAFVFSTLGFLLTIPAVIIAASFLSMMGTGDKTSTIAMGSDTVFYAIDDIKKSFETTSCNLVTVYGTNTSDIQRELNTTWAQYIEQDYAKKTGINVSIPEELINVSYNSVTTKIEVGNLNTNQSIPVNITYMGSSISYEGGVGPLALSTDCDEETIGVSGSAACSPSDLIITIISPGDSFITDNCPGTTVNISATVQDTCGTDLVGTNAVVTASFDNGDASINLTDADENGVYTVDWSPSNPQTPTEITVTTIGTGTWDGLSDSDSVGAGGTCASQGMVIPCTCTAANITTCIFYPSAGYTTDNCPGTRASVNATVQDNCGTFLTNVDVSGGVLRAYFSNGDADATLSYSSANFTGTWDPDTAQNPTTITVEANGSGSYAGISDTDNVSVGVTACGCIPTDIIVNITSPSGGFSTDNCDSTSVTISATVKDTCGTNVPVTDGALTASFDNGDANLSLTDPDGDSIYTADWTPGNVADSTVITVYAAGADDWENMNDTDSVSGAVTTCAAAECSCDGSFPNRLPIGISDIDEPCLNSSADIVFEMKVNNEDTDCLLSQIKYRVECKTAVAGGCPSPRTLQEGYFNLSVAPGSDITTAKQAWITGVDLTNMERIKVRLRNGKYCEGTEKGTEDYDDATDKDMEVDTQAC